MHDRDDDNDDLLVTTREVDELKTITFLLKGLYGRLKQEQEAISLASGQVSFSAEQFKEYMVRIEKFEQAYRKYVADTTKENLSQSAKEVANEISKQVSEQAVSTINQTITHLNQLSGRVEREFERQITEVGRMRLVFSVVLLAASLAGGLLGGLVVHHYFPENDDTSHQQMAAGSVLMKAYPQLNQAEKDKILRLGTS